MKFAGHDLKVIGSDHSQIELGMSNASKSYLDQIYHGSTYSLHHPGGRTNAKKLSAEHDPIMTCFITVHQSIMSQRASRYADTALTLLDRYFCFVHTAVQQGSVITAQNVGLHTILYSHSHWGSGEV